MTEKEKLDFFGKVEGKKIRATSWDIFPFMSKDFFIPKEIDIKNNKLIGIYYDGGHNPIKEVLSLGEGFNFNSHYTRFKFIDDPITKLDIKMTDKASKGIYNIYDNIFISRPQGKLSKLFTLTKNYITDLINLFRN
jgi:hypothetical protein